VQRVTVFVSPLLGQGHWVMLLTHSLVVGHTMVPGVQGHDGLLAAHFPFQHMIGVALGHLASHCDASATHRPLLSQRAGASRGHGQLVMLGAQVLSEHFTSNVLQTTQVAVSATQDPSEHFCGLSRGQGQRAAYGLQVESQHCTSLEAQPVHMSMERAQLPLGHSTRPEGQTSLHLLAFAAQRQRLNITQVV